MQKSMLALQSCGAHHTPPLREEDWQRIPLNGGKSQEPFLRECIERVVAAYWEVVSTMVSNGRDDRDMTPAECQAWIQTGLARADSMTSDVSALGVQLDLSRTGDGVFLVSNTEKRKADLCRLMGDSVTHCLDPKMMIPAADGSSTEQNLNQSRHIRWTTTVHREPQCHHYLFRRRKCIQLFLFGRLFRLSPGRFLRSEEHINVRCANI